MKAVGGLNLLTNHKSATKDGRVSRCTSSALYNNPDDENDGVDNDGILSRDQLSEETRIQGASPGAQFENRGEPSFLCLIGRIFPHVCVEGIHRPGRGCQQ